jgi:Holliday junction DNA helicase RuvA
MIDFLKGIPVLIESDCIVLDVRDVGYRIFCANPHQYANKTEQSVILYTHHYVREDVVLLFGFATREEQTLFRKLLEVSGIGPRVALGMLSGGTPEAIVHAITHDDTVFLTRLPGIGKKTAQRLVLDLRDKLETSGIMERMSKTTLAKSTDTGHPMAWREAKEALLALGYSEAETDRAWRDVKGKMRDSDHAEQLIKLALQLLYKA